MSAEDRIRAIEKRRSIAKRLEELETRDGRLTPEAVVAEARNPESPLHGEFQWDVDQAAMQRWLSQARQLITSVKVEFYTRTTVIRVPRYVRDPDQDSQLQGYVAVPTLISDEERKRRTVVQEMARAVPHLSRAANLATAFGLSADIAALVHQVNALAERLHE